MMNPSSVAAVYDRRPSVAAVSDRRPHLLRISAVADRRYRVLKEPLMNSIRPFAFFILHSAFCLVSYVLGWNERALPGGGSLITAQKAPTSFTASTNSGNWTGLTM